MFCWFWLLGVYFLVDESLADEPVLAGDGPYIVFSIAEGLTESGFAEVMRSMFSKRRHLFAEGVEGPPAGCPHREEDGTALSNDDAEVSNHEELYPGDLETILAADVDMAVDMMSDYPDGEPLITADATDEDCLTRASQLGRRYYDAVGDCERLVFAFEPEELAAKLREMRDELWR